MDRGPRVAAIALHYPPCSARGPDTAAVGRYAELLVRPADPVTTAARAYYLQNPPLSTCALTVLACWRLAGCTEPECAEAYYPARVGKAFSDVQALAVRYGAWETAPSGPLRAGDAWVITVADGSDGHMGLCVADQGPDGPEGPLETVEGGQFDGKGSTAIGRFRRTLVRSFPGGHLMMGSRMLYGVVRAEKLPIPDSNAP